ncbi:MAG: tetratricopeptide repeat protein [Rhodospirillales bacterium]
MKAPNARLSLAATALAALLLAAPAPALAAASDGARGGHQPGTSHLGNYLAGRHAQVMRDLDAAAVYLGAALANDGGSENLLRRTFLVLVSDGEVEKAIPLARRVIEVRQEDAIAFLTLTVAAFADGDYGQVGVYLDRLDGAGFGQFFRPLFASWARVGEGDTDAALAALEPLGADNGTRALHDTHAALINALDGRFDQAIDLMVRVMELQGGFSLRTTELLGGVYEAAGDVRSAEAIYNGFLGQYPDSRLMRTPLKRLADGDTVPLPVTNAAEGVAEALFGVASSFDQQNAPETALILAQLANYLRPGFPPLQLMTGNLIEHLYGAEQANDVLGAIDPESDYAWSADLRRAANFADLGQIEEAEGLLRNLAARDPSSPDPMIDLGDLYRSEARFGDAVDAYDAAFERIGEPQARFWSLHYARGIALERDDQWERAEADFLQALAYEPDQALVLNYLGYSWLELGINLERALDMIRKAVDLRPNDGYIIDSLGWAFYRLGRWEDAVRELERAVERRPEDPIINDHLGDAYWKVGRFREARFQWRRSLSLEPEEELIPVIEKKITDGLPADKDGGTDS